MGTRIELSFRDRAILRAVAGGGAELLLGVDQISTSTTDSAPIRSQPGRSPPPRPGHARAGLIVAAVPGTTAHRVPASLTATGREHAFQS